MNITVFGAGYVGLVSAVCFATLGHRVICMDIDQGKMQQLQNGQPTLYEQDLAPLLQAALNSQQLHFTSELTPALADAELIILAVGTPTSPEGEADLSYLFQAVRDIAKHINHPTTLVIKSTVPPGTGDKIDLYLQQALEHRQVPWRVLVANNPEFLQEGSAMTQFMQPDRIIVGAKDIVAMQQLYDLHRPLLKHKQQFLLMSRRSAELSKYAANAFLATKISFINEIGELAESIGADINEVKRGIGSDPRINPFFLNAGCGYGGSCFPKDLLALSTFAQTHQVSPGILTAVQARNHHAQRQLFERIKAYFHHDLHGKTLALWGLTFKPNTDDVRFAPSLSLVESLMDSGAKVRAFDPMGMENFKHYHASGKRLYYASSAHEALRGADALIIATEWPEFKEVPIQSIVAELRQAVIFDGRQLWPLATMRQHPVYYYSTGRPTCDPQAATRKQEV